MIQFHVMMDTSDSLSFTCLIAVNPYQSVLRIRVEYSLSEHYNKSTIMLLILIVHSRLLCHLSFLILISYVHDVCERISMPHSVISKFYKEVMFGIIKQVNQTNVLSKLWNHYFILVKRNFIIKSIYQIQSILK